MPVRDDFATRYRVRSAAKTWNDQGPDLLRPRQNARRQLAALIHDAPDRLWTKAGDADWREVASRAAVLDRFTSWDGLEFRVAVREAGDLVLLVVVKRERIPISTLPHCSPRTSLNWSLTHFQFPDALFAGGYVWKQVKGSDSWSDHAWGTAFDITQHGSDTCAKITDWTARMARARCIVFDYALGTLDGKTVVYVDAHGDTRPSSASDSHLWHMHQSVTDHDGRKPPREGGVW